MEMHEFVGWIDNHSALFPEWRAKLEQVQDFERTISLWMRSFREVSLESANQASQELLEGKLKAPFTMADHVSIVRARSREIEFAKKPRTINAVEPERFLCVTCFDSGVVSIAHPSSLREGFPKPAAVFCVCALGDRYANNDDEVAGKSGRANAVSFDPERHIVWTGDAEQMLADYRAMKPPNYQTSFDDFNQG